jgi:hypothetical protein
MKKIILFIGILLGFVDGSFAQLNETELTPILQDAKEFAEKSNQEGFEYSIEQFAAWLEVKTLKPQSLNQTNRILLISALKTAFNNDIIKDNNKHLSLFFEFLKYESENNDDEENWHWLGFMYMEGLGVNKHYITAKYWYEKAIEKGYGKAMTNLGIMHHFGLGVTQNYLTAKYWYEKAAEKEDATAMYIIGIIYQEGQGITQSNTTAKYWLERACNLGYQDACDNYKTIK